MTHLEEFFYVSGQIVWLIIFVIASFAFVLFFYEKIIKPCSATVTNLYFFFFGKRRYKGTYLELWQNNFAHRGGVREHWKSWISFRRLAYIKLLKEARKELHSGKKIENKQHFSINRYGSYNSH